MGFLALGEPLSWDEAKDLAEYVRQHGIEQFIAIYERSKSLSGCPPFWGDEVEYILVKKDSEGKKIFASLRGAELAEFLNKEEEESKITGIKPKSIWRPEFASFMLEGTPGVPYEGAEGISLVKESMVFRRQLVNSLLSKDEALMTLSTFPLLGVGNFTTPPYEIKLPQVGESKDGPAAGSASSSPSEKADPREEQAFSQSCFIPDYCIFPHPRFQTLTRNIRTRKGSKVRITVPLFIDEKTLESQLPPQAPPIPYPPRDPPAAPSPHIYMDCMAAGMGNCCIQCTFQTQDISEARWIYDQFAVLCPVMLALTASTPIYAGYLADTDVRWNIVASSVDDRTEKELAPKSEGGLGIPKSRYGSISCYLSERGNGTNAERYSDIELPINQSAYDRLREAGVDHLLAKHMAHLFIRDPLVVFRDRVELDDGQDADHFENIQSTNWQTVRFKPPPPNSDIGWRVEFRVMEVQLTDAENAALVSFIMLLMRALLTQNINLYMPISLVDKNLAIAHERDAARTGKFVFRTNVEGQAPDSEAVLAELSADEIMNGKEGVFVGIIPLVRKYVDTTTELSEKTRALANVYLKYISNKAAGKILTTATYFRNFVQSHPAYQKDSRLTQEVAHDFICHTEQIIDGTMECSQVAGCLLKNLKKVEEENN